MTNTDGESNDGRSEDHRAGRSSNQASDRDASEGPNDESASPAANPPYHAPGEQSKEVDSVIMDQQQDDAVKSDQLLCDAEINQNHEQINTQQLEIDKQLLTLSSGLIVLSLTFAKDIAPKGPGVVWLLVSGLIIIAGCIGCVLFSFRWSIAGLEKAQQYWRARRDDTYGEHSFPIKHASTIKVVNVVSCWLFGTGFACITLFVTLNITKEIGMGHSNFQEGSTVKVPTTTAPSRSDTAGTTVKVPVPPPPPPRK